MTRPTFSLILLLIPLTCQSQTNLFQELFTAAFFTPGIKDHLPRTENNKICLETLYTGDFLPGNLTILLEGRELQLRRGEPQAKLGDCEALIEKFSYQKRKAHIHLQIGEQLWLHFTMKQKKKQWYTRWLIIKRHILLDEKIMVEKSAIKLSWD